MFNLLFKVNKKYPVSNDIRQAPLKKGKFVE